MNAEFLLEQLKVSAGTYGDDVAMVCNYLLDDPKFLLWSGSSESFQHHYGMGGLIRHTYEVVTLCLDNAKFFTDPKYNIDEVELFMAALFHDAGKLYDYEPVNRSDIGVIYDGAWGSTNHKRYIHHISRSALMWSEACKKNNLIYEKYHDRVLHAILAHHGARENGSPVAPKSRVAWLVCFCDGISARMYDADTLDVIKGRVQ